MIYNIKKKMKSLFRFTVYILLPLGVAGVGVSSCSDKWDEHYETEATSNGTLWQALSDPQGNTTQFARVLKAAHYDIVLNGSQTYTVFAPVDGLFTAHDADSLIALYDQEEAAGHSADENKVVRQFIQNHIALYKVPVAPTTDDVLMLMNNKYYAFTSSKLGNRDMTSANKLCDNGLLYTISDKLDYFPNIFEYLGMDSETDSAYRFFESYNVYELNEDKSVPGDVIDGEVTYLDYVYDLRNKLFSNLGLINSEDSTYWMLCPTNSEWNRLVSEYEPYFNYPNNVAKRDSLVYANTRLAFMNGTLFSKSVNSEAALQDSAVSTMATPYSLRAAFGMEPSYIYYKPFASGGIFDQAKDITCSNGHVMKTSHFSISKYDTFMQTVKVEAENLLSQNYLSDAIDPVTIQQVKTNNAFYGKVSGNAFIEVKPSTPTAQIVISYDIPNLLSGTKYDVYAVFVPATAADPLAVEESKKPCRIVSRVKQTDQNGMMSEPPLRNAKTTTAEVVDTVKLSTVTISTCSYGLSDALVRLDLKSNVQEDQIATYSNTLRLDCFIFEPVKDN